MLEQPRTQIIKSGRSVSHTKGLILLSMCVITLGNEIIDLEVKTGSSIRRSEMKSLAAMLEGPIQYIEIPLGCAFFLLDCSNVLNDQHETE